MKQIRLCVVTIGLAGAAAEGRAQQGDDLALAHALYASADYEAALEQLEPLAKDGGGADALEADRLRVLCLMALGRSGEADAIIARIFTTEPQYELGADVSPRVRSAFNQVRDRVLPGLGRRLYDEGKAAFDRRAYDDAVEHFDRALPVLEALAVRGVGEMEDMRVVANGFLTLSRQLLAPPPSPPALLPATTWAVRPLAALKADDVPSSEPVAIRQDLPPWSHGLGGPDAVFTGALEVLIDGDGRVEGAEVVIPVHPLYDAELLRATRAWRYEPARRAGQPVPSRKRVEVTLRSR
jgi:TonB family protein